MRKQIKKAMIILGDIDLINTKKKYINQKKLHEAFNILDKLDARLEREEIRRKTNDQ